jgi:hypothetical protein
LGCLHARTAQAIVSHDLFGKSLANEKSTGTGNTASYCVSDDLGKTHLRHAVGKVGREST